MLGIFLNEE